jgi:HAD superfamily hydrolase (TIGR01509 family)
VKTIIFDMDGVLFDTERFGRKAWDAAGKHFGIEGLGDVSLQCIGTNAARTKEIITEAYHGKIPYDEVRSWRSEYAHRYFRENGMPMKPGVRELLSWLREEGWKTGLSTSTRREAVEEELAIAGLTGFFDVIVCGDELKASKPAPDIFLRCAEELHAEPSETPVIEDSFNGIRAAYRAGMRPVMVPDMAAPDEEITELCWQICTDLYEVKNLLAAEYFSNPQQRAKLN